MGSALFTAWVLGVAALWPRAWAWDHWTNRARFDAWDLTYIVAWPLTAVLLGLAITLEGGWRLVARFQRERPQRELGGRRLTWIG